MQFIVNSVLSSENKKKLSKQDTDNYINIFLDTDKDKYESLLSR